VDHYEPGKLVSLGTIFTISMVLVFGGIPFSPSIINVALAVDMLDAPATQDTVTAGEDETDDNEDDEVNGQPDDLPDPEDAPVTTETITPGENEDSKEDKEDKENVDKAESSSAYNALPIQACPNNQERALFTETCVPSQSCGNDIVAGASGLGSIISPNTNNCFNAPTVDKDDKENVDKAESSSAYNALPIQAGSDHPSTEEE
jgi:hypothetical protein